MSDTRNRSDIRRRRRAHGRLAVCAWLATLTAAVLVAAAAPAVQAAPAPAAAPPAAASTWPTRYQNWSQVPGNYAGVVFHPYGDKFEVWEYKDGFSSKLYWNYKGVDDDWHRLDAPDGIHKSFNLNLREDKHVYFIIQTDRHETPSYVSEYRISGR